MGKCDALADQLADYLHIHSREKISLESKVRVNAEGCFLPSDTDGESAYKTTREHVYQFIEFLRACGGFKIC